MWELFAEPGQRVSQLSQVLSIHPSTASNLLDKLERKALVRRERAGPDQRVVRLYLTDSGAALLGHAPRPAQGALTDALLRQSDQVLAELDADLARLVAAMRVKDESAALQPLSGS
jgi:DNA-binding MarR family transcriptional regulator